MRLMIFRHGIAEDHAADGTDASRRRTREGVAQMKQIAPALKKIARRPDAILHSPRVRAAQTAEPLGKAFDRKPQVLPVLAEENPKAILDEVCRRKEETLLLVGHEPTLGRMVQILLSGSDNGFVQMKKAGCACVDVEVEAGAYAGKGELKWLVTPKILEAIS